MLSRFKKHKEPNTEKEPRATDKQSLPKSAKPFFGKSYTTYGTFEVDNTTKQLSESVKTEETATLKLSS